MGNHRKSRNEPRGDATSPTLFFATRENDRMETAGRRRSLAPCTISTVRQVSHGRDWNRFSPIVLFVNSRRHTYNSKLYWRSLRWMAVRSKFTGPRRTYGRKLPDGRLIPIHTQAPLQVYGQK